MILMMKHHCLNLPVMFLSFSDHEQIGDSNMQVSGNSDMSENVANLCEYDVSEAPEVIIVEIGMNESDDHGERRE
jgi:hypothetical protein